MRSSSADSPEQETTPLPDLDAPATPDDLRLLQQAEAAFGSHLPEGYKSLLQPAENAKSVPESAGVPLPEGPEMPDGPEMIDGPEMMDNLTAFIRRFVACSEDQLAVLALWVLHTWCFKAFRVTPLLNVYSAERRTGKTTCLQLLRCLCPHPWYACAPAPATVIAKTLRDSLTILLDDRHLTFSLSGRQQVVNFLACGLVNDELYWQRSGTNAYSYNVFSPRALAGRRPLPPALADRSIPLRLRHASPSAIKRVHFARHEPDYLQIIQSLHRWVEENFDVLSSANPESDREHLPQLHIHQQNHVEPLLMLADLIGDSWPERVRSALARIFRDAGNDNTNQSIQLLYDLREAFRSESNPDRLSTSFLVGYLCELANRPWAEWNDGKPLNGRSLALLLEHYEISPDKQRTGSLGSVRGYNRKDFLPHWQKFFDEFPEAGCSASEPEHGMPTGTAQLEAI